MGFGRGMSIWQQIHEAARSMRISIVLSGRLGGRADSQRLSGDADLSESESVLGDRFEDGNAIVVVGSMEGA